MNMEFHGEWIELITGSELKIKLSVVVDSVAPSKLVCFVFKSCLDQIQIFTNAYFFH